MPTPSELVTAQFALAKSYASQAQSQLTSFTNALNDAIYVAPTWDLEWKSLAVPSIPAIPAVPVLPTIAYVPPTAPSAFSASAPTITIDDFTETAPVSVYPTAPVVSYGAVPTIPAVGTVTVPTAPTINAVATPSYIVLNVPTFAGVDLHEDYLAKLDNIPVLNLVEPTPYSYVLGPEYASALLDALTAKLLERIAGGTGLDPAVEAAIWGRAQTRETQLALANEAEIMRNSDALGFHLPAGVLAAQLREAQQQTSDKLSTFSRDVAIKQAELEQANLKDTIAEGMKLEAQLIDYSYKMESLAFESAKAAVTSAVAIYNAQVDAYKALLAQYQLYATVYQTLIDAEKLKVQVYQSEVEAESTKADINKVMVEQYKAEIEASLATVRIYEVQVKAAETLVEIEKIKIEAAGEQVKAYAAQVNAETSKVEAYKATVDAETSKVATYKVKADVFGVVVNAQAEEARLRLGEYTAKAAVKTQEWEGYRAQVQSEQARMTALATQSASLTDGYKAAASATETNANVALRTWEAQIAQYKTGIESMTMQYKLNQDYQMETAKIRLDTAKVGAQVYAQLASSSYTMANANATVSGTGGTSVAYSYSNQTSSQVPALAAI